MERARDGCGRESEHVDLEAQRAQKLLLGDPEALLLVEDDEAELLWDDVPREDPVGSDQDVDLALGEVAQHRFGLTGPAEARDHLDPNGKVAIARAERVPVLLGEDRGWGEHERLLAVDGDGEGRAHRHLGLAEPDVAADEPIHRALGLEILLDRLDRPALILRLAVRELGLEPLEPLVLHVVGDARRRLPLRVEGDQLAGELLHRGARAALEELPRLPAELGERGRLRVGADVARDLAELLVRDVEPVLAAERQQEVVARDARDGLGLEAHQLADAVILVDDEVARAQVGEGLERPAHPGAGTRGALAKDLRVGQERKPELTPDEAPPDRRDGEEEVGLSRKLAVEYVRLHTPEQVLRPERVAPVREGDDDPEPGLQKGAELVLGLGETACGEGGPLRLERERLAAREGVELRGSLEAKLAPEFLAPDRAHLVGLPDEVGDVGEGRPEVAGHRRRLPLIPMEQTVTWIDEVEAALGGGVHDRVLYRVERPLGEGREGAHGLDLVPEEVDAERLAARRREDVEDAAPHRKLAALLDAVGASVTGEGELLREPVQSRLGSDLESDGGGSGAQRRHPLRKRRGRGADEAPRGEDVERAGALADEVGRGLEPRAVVDAAAREERDALVAEQPRRSLRDVARVAVLRRNEHERTRQPLVQRREHERQGGLGNACARWQGLCERGKTLVLGELADECVQDRTVHDEGPERGFRAFAVYPYDPVRTISPEASTRPSTQRASRRPAANCCSYRPPYASSSPCVPRSAIRPRSRTKITSALRIVERRWAIAIVVRPRMSGASACWTMRSLAVSSEEVASSRMSTRGSRSTARARATRCFSPPESR